MGTIPKKIVTETWQKIGAMGNKDAMNAMNSLSKKQPDLLAFILEFTQELHPDAQELAVYLFLVIYRIFEKHSSKPIKKVSAKKITNTYEEYHSLLEGLENAHEKFLERRAEAEFEKQPHITSYVLEALMEENPDDPIDLTDDDIGYIYIILKTVIDILDDISELC